AMAKSRLANVAGIAWRDARLTNWARLLVNKGSLATKRASGRSRARVAKTALISRLLLALWTWICNPMARAAGSTSLNARSPVKDADHRHRRLLRAHHERPRGRRAAEKRDERAPFHSITSSASARRVGGISRPIVLAVCRLMTNSNLVALSTGRSVGFSPL